MFEISTKLWYGLRAVIEIARKDQPTPVSEISKTQGLPTSYLVQILHRLKKAGILESHRGRDGGYKLRRRPDEITLHEILIPLGGEVAIAPCLDPSGKFVCDLFEICESVVFWRRIQDSIKDIMENTFLSELVDQRKP